MGLESPRFNVLKYIVYGMLGKKHEESDKRVQLDDESDGETTMTEQQVDEAVDVEKVVEVYLDFGKELSQEEADERRKFTKYFSNMVNAVLQAKEHRGKKNEYYRAFASDFYVCVCKEKLYKLYDLNENAAFSVMDTGLVDFTFTDKCRSFDAIERTRLKEYKDINITGNNSVVGEIKPPFKNCVFAMYFGCHESRVSQFRGDFRKEISTMVKWEGNHRGGI